MSEDKQDPEIASHSLHTPWSLWTMSASSKKDTSWTDRQTLACEFVTVEEFWGMNKHMIPPSQFGMGDFSLFRKGIIPAWEDPAFENGGRFILQFPSKMRSVDEMWSLLMLLLIGEMYDDTVYWQREGRDLICGAVCSQRHRATKFAIWFSLSNEPLHRNLERVFMRALSALFPERKPPEISFETFKESGSQKGGERNGPNHATSTYQKKE